MNNKRTLRRVVVAMMLLVSFLFQGTWALAGTTGGIAGFVTETSGAPVADATVNASSPSGIATTRTDSQGHFNFLALSPDTYTLTVVKDGYSNGTLPGVVVFADQTSVANVRADKTLTTIAHVKAVGTSTGLVKSGVTADQYSVDATTAQAAAALGGGSNLDTTYSAIASVPGVNVTLGGMGWNQNVYVRGSQSYFTSYEYDGVPVNRAFDNYNSSTESNLGLQELQVYTGGGPAGNSSSGTSGFINQVIKTGTYPGYASFSGGLGADAFYHMAKFEAGGSTPDRNFSYYVGISGSDQAFRFLNNQNGANLMGPGGIYSDYSPAVDEYGGSLIDRTANLGGAYPQCNQQTGATPAAVQAATGLSDFCLYAVNGISELQSFETDRENVINLHFGIPRKDGQRDDLQVLYSASSLKSFFYGSPDDEGGVNNFMLALNGSPYSAPPAGGNTESPYNGGSGNYPFYTDAYVYNLPFGANPTNATPSLYLQPDSPSQRQAFAEQPSNTDDTTWNDTGIIKLQYTHPLSDRAYARLFAYTFYSDWTLTGPLASLVSYTSSGYPFQNDAANYILSTHTTGGEFQLSDQINDKNLVSLTTNYTRANVLRDNNSGFTDGTFGSASPVGIISKNSSGQYTCYAGSGSAAPGSVQPCYAASVGYADNAEQQPGYFGAAAQQTPFLPGTAASLAGAQYANLWDGPEDASYNTVLPQVLTASLTDQFRPSDKLLFNAGVRYESYNYGLDPDDSPADNFYGQIISNYTCFNPTTGEELQSPLGPGAPPPPDPVFTNAACPTGYAHPNGTTQNGVTAPLWTLNSPNSYKLSYYSARLSGTYTESPDTVWRFEGGRYIEPPISASVQYLNSSGDNLGQWASFENLGFFTPFHPIPAQSAGQYDVSLERHIRGTDVSFKLTPFYNLTNGYQEQSFIGPGYVTQIPVGQFRSMGVEAAITKGDFNRNGLSGQLAVTYTDAQVRFQSGLGPNQISLQNDVIDDYNALTKAGGGSPCYTAAVGTTAGTGVATCGIGDISNPYYNLPKQGLENENGWYAPAGDATEPGVYTDFALYNAPWVSSLILNYRKDKLAITPSVQFLTGSSYGSPYDVLGVDPRLCGSTDPSASNPNQCNYTSLTGGGDDSYGELYIPNWQTGNFSSLGEFHNPNILTGNLAITYDINPRVTARITLTNVFHTCFGGTKAPWTAAYAPGPNICSYADNGAYVSNFQLGNGAANPQLTSAYSAAANGTTLYPWQQQSYEPENGTFSGVIPQPFNAYFQLEVKL